MHQYRDIHHGISATPLWQVFLVLLTALMTTALAYYFTDRSRRKREFLRAKAAIRRYGYLLQQAYSNRMQSELDSNYYELRSNFATNDVGKNLFNDLAKATMLLNPGQSLEISRIYGKLIENLQIIESLAKSESFQAITKEADSLIYEHGSMKVESPVDIRDDAGANDYVVKGKEAIEQIIEDQLRKEFRKFIKKLQNVTLSSL